MTIRTEHVGSLLRPDGLLDARRQVAEGRLDADALRTLEDDAVRAALRAQEQTGIDVVTDGEFRREEFRAGFAAAVSGLVEEEFDLPWRGAEGKVMVKSRRWRVDGPVRQTAPIAVEEARFVAANTSVPFKITLPSPGFMAERFVFDDGSPYETTAELADAFRLIMQDEIARLVAEGVPYIQIDNPGYAAYLDDDSRARMVAAGKDPSVGLRAMLDCDVALLSAIPRTDALTVALHVCRGNNASYWMNEGGYEPIAEQLFGSLPVDRLLLEFDDDRSGTFEVLKFTPKDKVAVLGLISTKVADVEQPDALMKRLDEAAQFIDADQLAISPQCGFATHAEGHNLLSDDAQYRKLRVAVETANRWFAGR